MIEKMAPTADEAGQAALSDDGFLDGRIKILQPLRGFRAAIDSVLLPAAIEPGNGPEVLDAGAGTGVAALCLLARCPGIHVTGVELQSDLAALAARNAARNGFSLDIQCRDFLSGPALAQFDQVMSNPPYHEEGRGTLSDIGAKARANAFTAEGDGSLARWIEACLAHLKPGGVLTLIHRAERMNEILKILSGVAGGIEVLPVIPRRGRPARRILVRARKGAKADVRVLEGFVLHDEIQKYAPEAEDVLRHGAAIRWGDDRGASRH